MRYLARHLTNFCTPQDNKHALMPVGGGPKQCNGARAAAGGGRAAGACHTKCLGESCREGRIRNCLATRVPSEREHRLKGRQACSFDRDDGNLQLSTQQEDLRAACAPPIELP